jgi:hypothetical protein
MQRKSFKYGQLRRMTCIAAASLVSCGIIGSTSALAASPTKNPPSEPPPGGKVAPTKRANPGPVATPPRAGVTSRAIPGQTRFHGACDFYNHRMYGNTRFKFDLNRYPRGGYVALRFAFARVNNVGQRITGWGVTRFIGKGLVRPAVHYEQAGPGGGLIQVVDFNNLGIYRLLPTWGHWVAAAQVVVWNGYFWEGTPWTFSNGYSNIDRFGGVHVASDCWASLNVF